MTKNILIAGANGFIGKNLINYFSKKKFLITGIYNSRVDKIKNKNINYIKCDLRNKTLVRKLFRKKKYDIIINSAAIIKTKNNKFPTLMKMCLENIKIQNNLINEIALNSHNVIFIFLSSISVYKTQNKNKQFSENDQLNFNDFYSLSKIYGENILEIISKKTRLRGISLRLAGVHGIGRTSGVIYNHIKNCLKNKVIQVNEPNSLFRLCFLEDINKAINLIIKKENKNKYSLYNIAGEEFYSLKELSKKIISLCKSGKLKSNQTKIVRNQVMNISKFKSEYSFRTYKLDNKINNIIKHLKNNLK